jgi:molybdenum cofactor biosynthesis enzyme MoaA
MAPARKQPTSGPKKFNRKRLAEISKMAAAARCANMTLSMTPNAIRLRQYAAARKLAKLPSVKSVQAQQNRLQRQQQE